MTAWVPTIEVVSGYTVTCLDGTVTTFVDRHEARTFAEWGHSCLGWHMLTCLGADGEVDFEDVMTGGGHTTVAQFLDKSRAYAGRP